jgi:UDP-perosamine 4-acetyltransferase
MVVFEAARLGGASVVGFLDDNPAAPIAAILIDVPHPFPTPPHLGPLERLEAIGGASWIVALGDVRMRRAVLSALGHRPPVHRAGVVVHPTAFVSPSASVGAGVYVGPQAVIHSRAKVGAHCIINSGAIVEHDCVLEENTHIAPGAVLGGTVHVGHDTLVGLGSRVLPGVRIGHGCTIGAGAVVLGEVRDGRRLVGVPAK